MRFVPAFQTLNRRQLLRWIAVTGKPSPHFAVVFVEVLAVFDFVLPDRGQIPF